MFCEGFGVRGVFFFFSEGFLLFRGGGELERDREGGGFLRGGRKGGCRGGEGGVWRLLGEKEVFASKDVGRHLLVLLCCVYLEFGEGGRVFVVLFVVEEKEEDA